MTDFAPLKEGVSRAPYLLDPPNKAYVGVLGYNFQERYGAVQPTTIPGFYPPMISQELLPAVEQQGWHFPHIIELTTRFDFSSEVPSLFVVSRMETSRKHAF
jgi:hypothetical protein